MRFDHEQLAAAMNEAAGRPFVVALEGAITTASGKVAFIARHSDGRNLAMMCPVDVTTHEQMIALAQAAFDGQGPSASIL
jgi:hypothetical protein